VTLVWKSEDPKGSAQKKRKKGKPSNQPIDTQMIEVASSQVAAQSVCREEGMRDFRGVDISLT
jgi:hypothetical protein